MSASNNRINAKNNEPLKTQNHLFEEIMEKTKIHPVDYLSAFSKVPYTENNNISNILCHVVALKTVPSIRTEVTFKVKVLREVTQNFIQKQSSRGVL